MDLDPARLVVYACSAPGKNNRSGAYIGGLARPDDAGKHDPLPVGPGSLAEAPCRGETPEDRGRLTDLKAGEIRFLAMDYVPGEDLAARLERGPPPLDEAFAVTESVAVGLEAARPVLQTENGAFVARRIPVRSLRHQRGPPAWKTTQ